jgi:hypothetical protein
VTALAPQSPAPQATAASGPAHRTPACSGGRVRNRRDRQRAARCVAGPEPARARASYARGRRPEAKPSSPAAPATATPRTSSRFGTAESP